MVDTTRTCTDELLTETRHKEASAAKKENLLMLNDRQNTDDVKNKLQISTSNKRSAQDAAHTKPKRPLSSTGDVSTSENSLCLNDKGHRRSQSAGKESELKSHAVQDKNPRRKNDELSKFTKKKSNQGDYAKTPKLEVKTKTTSEVTQSETVNCVKSETKHHSKAEKPVSKKEQSEKTNTSAGSPRKSTHSKQQTTGGLAHGVSKSSSPRDTTHSGVPSKTVSDSTQASVRRSKDVTNAIDDAQNSSTVE